MCLAVPGKIVDIEENQENAMARRGRIDFGGVFKVASLAFVPEAKVGDYVIVHVGVAISTLNEKEAHKIFEYLEQIGELEEIREKSL
ncbi:MAG: HypC/HybG/HupF family hydrogenase formation chaperone [Deltaproteobacteria bacterium]|nr:HypC/HybG/HupF family hydrogenase formation chaperone [Deltaproteobacteria bacterium]MBI3294251.1 HypC/HybG/HupF family hydrogenase formation chaperone [Deltaproteobacteria bacterium]